MVSEATTERTSPLQWRTMGLLAFAQIFSGLATGAVVSTGALLALELSGSEAWSGTVVTTMTLGAAIASAVLMRVAIDRGRRIALSTGLLVAAIGTVGTVVAAVVGAFWLLLVSAVLIGAVTAVNLQARFAATDLSADAHRGRDLSLVVWMATIGSVAGPNLIGVGEVLAEAVGLPGLAGIFVISTAGMVIAMLVIWIGLRPDPYLVLTGRQREDGVRVAPADGAVRPARPSIRQGLRTFRARPLAREGLVAVVAAHAVMVSVMAMTPVHMIEHGATVTIIGVTVSLHIAGMFALSPVMGVLADRVGGRATAAGGLVLLVIAALVAGASGAEHWVTTVGLILLGVGWSAATVAGSALIVDATPVAERVAAQGTSDTLMSLGGALGGLLAGFAIASVGFLGLGVGSAVVLIAALAVVLATGRARAA